MNETLKILALCLAAAVVYGVVHDEVTVQISREYFTLGHPPVFGEDVPSPLLALGWGVLATWWAGGIVGALLAVAARAGPEEKTNAAALVRPVALLLGVMAVLAAVAGVAGYFLAQGNLIHLNAALAGAVPADRQTRFLAAGAAHLASYAAGFVGGLALVFRTGMRRRRAAHAAYLSRAA